VSNPRVSVSRNRGGAIERNLPRLSAGPPHSESQNQV